MAKTQADKLKTQTNAGFDAEQSIREAQAIDRLARVAQQEDRWSKVVKALDGPLSTIGW